jgi:membrane-associated phospholipid phosphatase
MPIEETIHDLSSLGGLPAFVVISALLVSFLPAPNQFELTLMFILGLATCFGVTAVIRWFWFRTRPQPQSHGNWYERIDAGSFPSMHAMRASFLSTVVVIMLRFSPIVIAASIIITIAVCWARVHRKRHHPIDVIAGAIIGVVIALAAMVLMAAVPYWF